LNLEVREIESIDVQDGHPCQLYAWVVLADGRRALWSYDLAKPPGLGQALWPQGD
jgi:hypothetical protein